MDTLKTIGVALVTALVAVFGFGAVSGEQLGYQITPGISMTPASVTTFTEGGGVNATSSANSATLVTSDIDDENVVAMTLTNGNGTVTFMASSSFPGIPNPGDARTLWIRNASTSASVGLTVAGATGAQLKLAASSTALLIGDTDGNNTARIDAVRKTNSDIVLYLTKFQD